MFRLNTDGVLLWGAGLCGRRYSRCTHCHEPHGGTVSNQTKSFKHDFFPVC
jgi:predicted CXXCH cytochrome family protein